MALDFGSLLSAFGLDTMFFWLDKFTAVITIWWLGGKFANRFKTKLTGLTILILRILTGVIIFVLGIIVGTRFLSFLPSSISDIAGAFIVYGVLYFVGSLLTSGMALNMVSRKEFVGVLERVDKIDALLNRLVEATTSKKIMPKKLEVKAAENSLKRVMKESKNIEEFVVLDARKDKDSIIFIIKAKIRSFEVVLDAYTGKLVEISHLKDTPRNMGLAVANYFYEHKAATLGAVLLVLIINYILLLNTPVVEQRIATLLSFEAPESNNTFSPTDLLGQLGFIPQGGQYSQEDLQDILSQMPIG